MENSWRYLTKSFLLPFRRSYLVWGSAAGSFPRSSTLVGKTAHSLPLNSSRAGKGRSHLRGEAQSGRRRASSRAAPARAGASAAAGSRCARAGGSAEAGRLGGPGPGRRARSAPLPPFLPRTLARQPAARSLALALTRAPPRRRRRPGPPRAPTPAASATAGERSRRVSGAPGGRAAIPASQPRPLRRFFDVLPALGPAVRPGRTLALSPAPSP